MRYLLLPCLALLTACATAQADPEARAIYLNQVGFSPDSPKIAIAHSDRDEPQRWLIHSVEGEAVMEGRTLPLGFSERAGQSLHRIEFEGLDRPGTYRLSIGETVSPDFEVATGLYRPLANDALAYFYHNRAGEPVLADHVGDEHARPAGHENEVVTCFEGTDNWGTEWPGCDYELDVTGGWYDAGDHGKYVVNAGISTWTIMDAHAHFGERLRTPDGITALDEARKNIEWMLSMQVPEGESAWVALGRQEEGEPLQLTEIENAGGLVHHKVHDESWAGDGVMPHENDTTRYLYPPSLGATLNLVAISARCARDFAEVDAAFAERCKQSSDKAWAAVTRRIRENMDRLERREVPGQIYAFNNFDGGGPYGDDNTTDEVSWAKAERDLMNAEPLSRNVQPQEAYVDETGTVALRKVLEPSFNSTALLDILISRDADIIAKTADTILADIPNEPLHIPFAKDGYQWGDNSAIANRGMVLGHAYLLTGERKYRNGVVYLMDYLLGRNPMGISYVTGYGDRPFENPHHRHWAHSVRDGAPKPPPGVLSGGPNNTNMSDPVAETMVGTCAAQTCYADDYGAWTLNEVTINWNAPLVWIAAFLDATEEDLEQ